MYRGKWRGQDVAVKQILSNKEKESFNIEIVTLTSVQHPNIIKLFGANDADPIMIVMEYAECGSLYKCKPFTSVISTNLIETYVVLHDEGARDIKYSIAHALSWVTQCAEGVNYLHSQTKPIVHRDLKPPKYVKQLLI